MKLFSVLAFLVAANAFAYVSPSQFDPKMGTYEHESTTVVKSQATGYNGALTRGMGLYLSENELTGANTVSSFYSGTGTDATSARVAYCVNPKRPTIQTTDKYNFPCVVRGYVDYALYDATTAIAKFDYLCVAPTTGVFKKCDSGVTSKFISLDVKASGTGNNLKMLIR